MEKGLYLLIFRLTMVLGIISSMCKVVVGL